MRKTKEYKHGRKGGGMIKVIPIIEAKIVTGSGKEEDPVRQVTQYWSLDGKLLFTFDDW